MPEIIPGLDDDIYGDTAEDYVAGTMFDEQKQTIRTLKRLGRIDKRLQNLGDAAYDKYAKLDTDVQDLLQFITNGERGYFSPPKTWYQTLQGSAVSTFLNLNPIGVFYNAAVQHGKNINTVINAGMQAYENDANLFDVDLWSNSYHNQEGLYNNDIDRELQKRYGKKKAFIAKQYLSGHNIAETIKNSPYGYSPEFIKELEDFVNNRDVWENTVLEDYRQAKISIGRFVARNVVGERGKEETGFDLGGIRFGSPMAASKEAEKIKAGEVKVSQEEKDLMFTRVSGTVDAVTQIFADPLTYLTFGVGGSVKLFGKIPLNETAKIVDLSRKGTAGIREAFDTSSPLKKTWDGFGGLIKEYSEAPDAVAQAKIKQRMFIEYPQLATDETIDFNVANKVFNADAAKEVYSSIDNVRRILSGRVDGTDFFRESIFVHRSKRVAGNWFRQQWYRIGSREEALDPFNPNSTLDEVSGYLDELAVYGANAFTGQRTNTPEIDKFLAERKKFIKRFATWVSRSPGDQGIRLGEGSIETLNTVRAYFRMIAPRNIADIAVEAYKTMAPSEQLSVLRGLYRGVMESAGVPQTKIREILAERFGSVDEAFSVNPENINPWTKQKNVYKGAAIDRDLSMVIGGLPWNEIQTSTANASLRTRGKTGATKSEVLNFLGGATNNSAVASVTRYWTFGNLFPKLGVRSSIDETFMAIVAYPMGIVKNIFSAVRGVNFAKAASGDEKTTGAVSLLTRKILAKITRNDNWVPARALTKEDKDAVFVNIMEKAEDGNWSEAQINHAMKVAIVDLSMTRIGRGRMSDNHFRYMRELLLNQVNTLEAASSQVARATAGKVDTGIIERLGAFDNQYYARLLEEQSIRFGKSFKIFEQKDLDIDEFAAAQLVNLNRLFINNKIGRFAQLGDIFIANNGLRTSKDFDNAVSAVMKTLNESDMDKLIAYRLDLHELVNYKGLTKQDAIREMLGKIFSEMYFVFHGSDDLGKFNDNLLAHFQNSPSVKDALKIDFDEYFDLAGDNIIQQKIKTNIIPVKDFKGNLEDWWLQGEEYLWNLMDRTVTDLFRNKAVTALYLTKRDELAGLEEEMLVKAFSQFTKSKASPEQIKFLAGETLTKGDYNPDAKDIIAAKRAVELTQKQAVEIVFHDAVNTALKYVDNPQVRTFMASGVRNVSRFYRATEDFYRRIYRLRKITPQVIYRMRLMHLGLNNAGITYENEEGEEYFFVPMDNVIYSVFNNFLSRVTLNEQAVVQPQFNRLTGKVVGLNPSFQDDAGIPYLSGPLAGLATVLLKAIAGRVFPTSPWVEDIDNVLLGDLGDDIDVVKAVTPSILQRLWKVLDTDENARHNHSSTLQAIAFNAAFSGLDHPGMKPNATPEQIDEYMDIVRVAAHNVQVMNAITGTVFPMSTSLQESMNLEDHWRETGTSNIRSAFFEIYEAVIEKYGDDIADPWELAKALYVGQNPGKLIYTVSREQKEIKPLLKKTEEVRDWLITNKDFVDKYGEAAYLFAPQTDGKINPSVYNWMQAAGLSEDINTKKYLKSINTIEVKQQYFQISKDLEKFLDSNADYTARKAQIESAERQRQMLLIAYPMLRNQLRSGDITIEQEEKMYEDLLQISKDDSSVIPAGTKKKLAEVLEIFGKGYAQMSIDPGYNSGNVLIRIAAKNKTIDVLTKVAGGDKFLMQLNRLIFFPMINYKVRDSFRASPLG